MEAVESMTTESNDVNARDNDGVPYCRKHHCRMRVVSGAGKTRGKDYLACPVEGCDERGTKIRNATDRMVPSSPVMCPRCQCACVRHDRLSDHAGVVLVCPKCKFSPGKFALPQLEVARQVPRRADVPGVGDR